MTKIRITARNNADARNIGLWQRALETRAVDHNGGKVVVVKCGKLDIERIRTTLNGMHEVASYEVTDG